MTQQSCGRMWSPPWCWHHKPPDAHGNRSTAGNEIDDDWVMADDDITNYAVESSSSLVPVASATQGSGHTSSQATISETSHCQRRNYPKNRTKNTVKQQRIPGVHVFDLERGMKALTQLPPRLRRPDRKPRHGKDLESWSKEYSSDPKKAQSIADFNKISAQFADDGDIDLNFSHTPPDTILKSVHDAQSVIIDYDSSSWLKSGQLNATDIELAAKLRQFVRTLHGAVEEAQTRADNGDEELFAKLKQASIEDCLWKAWEAGWQSFNRKHVSEEILSAMEDYLEKGRSMFNDLTRTARRSNKHWRKCLEGLAMYERKLQEMKDHLQSSFTRNTTLDESHPLRSVPASQKIQRTHFTKLWRRPLSELGSIVLKGWSIVGVVCTVAVYTCVAYVLGDVDTTSTSRNHFDVGHSKPAQGSCLNSNSVSLGATITPSFITEVFNAALETWNPPQGVLF